MDKRTVFLVRHGKLEIPDGQRRYIGQLDLPLSLEGRDQACTLQRRLSKADIQAVFASDLSRSLETGRIIAKGLDVPLIQHRNLREIALGEWEGMSFADISRRFPREFERRGQDIGYYRIPGGESFSDCSKRVTAAFYDILDSSQGNILFAGHAGSNRLILCHLLGMPLANLFRVAQDYGCLNAIQTSRTGFQVTLVNSRTYSVC